MKSEPGKITMAADEVRCLWYRRSNYVPGERHSCGFKEDIHKPKRKKLAEERP